MPALHRMSRPNPIAIRLMLARNRRFKVCCNNAEGMFSCCAGIPDNHMVESVSDIYTSFNVPHIRYIIQDSFWKEIIAPPLRYTCEAIRRPIGLPFGPVFLPPREAPGRNCPFYSVRIIPITRAQKPFFVLFHLDSLTPCRERCFVIVSAEISP